MFPVQITVQMIEMIEVIGGDDIISSSLIHQQPMLLCLLLIKLPLCNNHKSMTMAAFLFASLVLMSHLSSCASFLHQSSSAPQINSKLASSSVEVVGAEGAIQWQMNRDICDEWLDQVLIERSSDAPNIFSVASSLVQSYMVNNNDQSIPLLRRITYCESKFDESIDSISTGDEHFEPLFGKLNKNDDDEVKKFVSSSITRTSKKNRKRTNLKITVAYKGLGFCGWEDQRHELYRSNSKSSGTSLDIGDQPLPSVQGTLADILGPSIGNPERKKPIEIKVAGRTDRGVSAIGQVCRVRTWKDIPDVEDYVQNLVNMEADDNNLGLRVTEVERVGPDFHPSFGASSRSYVYLIDLDENSDNNESSSLTRNLVPRIDRMLRELEGKELDYFVMSHGKVKTETTLCTLYHSRASIVDDGDRDREALCFELVGNRFLRRMVRLLVGTALREAYRGGSDDSLLRILASRDRKERSRAAPPDGLIFVRAEI